MTPAALTDFAARGYATLPGLYAPAEVAALLACIESAPAAGPSFRRSQDVFAIRNLLGEVPALVPLLATQPCGRCWPNCSLGAATSPRPSTSTSRPARTGWWPGTRT